MAKKILFGYNNIDYSFEDELKAARKLSRNVPQIFEVDKKLICNHCCFKTNCEFKSLKIFSYCTRSYRKFLLSKGFTRFEIYAIQIKEEYLQFKRIRTLYHETETES